jgi:hypothetical protein
VGGRVSEPRGNPAEDEIVTSGRDVVRDAEGAITAGDDRGAVRGDALGQPRLELGGVSRVGDVEVGVEGGASEVDGAAYAIGAPAAGPLVQEDRCRTVAYGSASMISVIWASVPVRK